MNYKRFKELLYRNTKSPNPSIPQFLNSLIPQSLRVFLVILVLGVVVGAGGGAYLALMHDMPQIQSLERFNPSAVTRIYASDKTLLAEFFVEKRVPISLDAIPKYLKNAIIATEDTHFYEHAGVDIKGVARALVKDIMARRFVEGASTITQQLAKTLFLTSKKTILRKIKEVLLAIQIERRYTKDEILALYLNQIYLGSGAYGVEAAANIYFGKSAQDLNLPECALVAGLPKSPSRYSPLVNRDLALKRRTIVLGRMRQTGVISEKEYQEAKEAPLVLAEVKQEEWRAPYFVKYVKAFLEDTLGQESLYKRGLAVYTTLDSAKQSLAEKVFKDGLEQLEKRINQGYAEGTKYPQGALVCLDAHQGSILAMVGGRDFDESRFNRATQALRQPGSAFKPIVYAYAIEQGFVQNDTIWDGPIEFKSGGEENWAPVNFSGDYKGEMTLRWALAVSENIPAVKLLNKLGAESVAQFAHNMGITSVFQPNLTLALGASEVALLELTAAYAVFPNQGIWVKPCAVVEVFDSDGRLLWRMKPQRRTVMRKESAYIITDMLQGVVQNGTGQKAKRIGRPLGGKTGTTNTYRDALFVGFSPTLVTGVWTGCDNHESIGDHETGGRAALPIWVDFMEGALTGELYHDFSVPENIIKVSIDKESGLLASQDCPFAEKAAFIKGTEPKEYCRH